MIFGMKMFLSGKKKLGKFLKYLSECIGVSKVYTNHSIRATSVTPLDEVGISSHHIVKVKGHGREVIIDPADDIWYENVPVGKNKLENFLKDLSECVGVSKVYTNHSIRATSVTLLDEAGISSHHIIKVKGHGREESTYQELFTQDDKGKDERDA